MTANLQDRQSAIAPNRATAGQRWPATLCALLLFASANMLAWPFRSSNHKMLTKSEVFSCDYEAMKEGPWSWWLSRAFLADQPVDVVLLGDSQMNAAVFQADAFTRKRDLDCVVDRQAITLAQDLTAPNASLKAVLNMAMAGGMASDQYLFCKALFPSAPPKLVVLGVGPRCFIDNSLPSASSTEPFQFFSRYVDLGPLTALAFSDQFAAAAWQIRHHLPLLVLHDQCCDLLRNTIQKDVVRITGSLPPTRSVFTDRPLKVSGTAANMLRAIYGSAGDAKLGEARRNPDQDRNIEKRQQPGSVFGPPA